jgi:PKD repeat protein
VNDYEADFAASTTNLCAGATVQFTDQSTAGSSSWRWSFPGGIPSTSNLRNPSVLYGSSGTYNVQLIVSNGVESDTLLRSNYIQV